MGLQRVRYDWVPEHACNRNMLNGMDIDIQINIKSYIAQRHTILITCTERGRSKIFCESISHSIVPDSSQPNGLYLTSLCPWNSPGKNTEVGSHFCLQGIFPPQGSSHNLLHWRQILYHQRHQGSLSLYSML